MTRYFCQVLLDSLTTQSSGEITGEGEFYLKCNGKRYPDIGVIKLKAKETFNPEPNPTFFTALIDDKEKQIKMDIEVWEEDVGKDDKFLDQEFKLPIKTTNQVLELKDKKNKCLLKLMLKFDVAKDW